MLTTASVYLAMTYFDKLDVSISPTEVESTALIEIVDGRGIVWDRSVFAVREKLKLRVGADGYKQQELEISDATWRRGQDGCRASTLAGYAGRRNGPAGAGY